MNHLHAMIEAFLVMMRINIVVPLLNNQSKWEKLFLDVVDAQLTRGEAEIFCSYLKDAFISMWQEQRMFFAKRWFVTEIYHFDDDYLSVDLQENRHPFFAYCQRFFWWIRQIGLNLFCVSSIIIRENIEWPMQDGNKRLFHPGKRIHAYSLSLSLIWCYKTRTKFSRSF